MNQRHYEYGQGYGQQNQNYNQQNQNYTQQAPNYGQQNQGYYQQNTFNGMPQKPVNPGSVSYIIDYFNVMLPPSIWCSGNRVFSAKINSAMLAGNLEEAQNNAKMARIWIIVSFGNWSSYMVDLHGSDRDRGSFRFGLLLLLKSERMMIWKIKIM